MRSPKKTTHCLQFFAIFIMCLLPSQARLETTYDLVIRDGRVIDPASDFDGIRSLGISRGTIQTIDEGPLQGRVVIDARGKIVTAGFIDLHSHAQTQLGQKYQVLDGVTTSLELEAGAYPVAAVGNQIADRPLINFGASASYAAMRSKVLTNSDNPYLFFDGRPFSFEDPGFTTPLDAQQIERVMRHVHLGLDQGGLGIGLLLDYMSDAVTTAELEALFTVAAERKAPLFIHIRRGMAGDPRGLMEVIDLAKKTGAPIHICHLSASAMGGIEEFLKLFHTAIEDGVDISAESYPYNAGSTSIGAAVFDRDWQQIFGITYADVQLAESGKYFDRQSWDKLRVENPAATIIHHYGNEDWTQLAVKAPGMMIGSDAMPVFSESVKSHPRGMGTFSRVLTEYVRKNKLLSLPEALAKMSYLPAARLALIAPQFKNKGRIQTGADADIVIFDANIIADQATYTAPYQGPKGISWVLVNGKIVVQDGAVVEEVYPGRIIMGAGSHPSY